MLLCQTSEDMYLICLCLKKENPVEILLIFCERANCIKGNFAETLSPKYSNTSKPTIKDLKIPRLNWIFNKIEFLLLFLFLFCPKINTVEILRSVRGGICHCRHCRRQCKTFASGVNFSTFTHFLCFSH